MLDTGFYFACGLLLSSIFDGLQVIGALTVLGVGALYIVYKMKSDKE
jgi:hypothetical protein